MLTWPEARLGLEILITTCLCHFFIFNINVIRHDSDDWVIHFDHFISESWLAAIILLGYNAISIGIVFLVRVELAILQRKRLLKALEINTAEEIWRLRRDRALVLLCEDAEFRLLSGAYFRATKNGHGFELPMPSTDLDEVISQSHELISSAPPYQNANKRKNKPLSFSTQYETQGQTPNSTGNTSSSSDDGSWSGISTSGTNSNSTETPTVLTSTEKADTQPAFPRTRYGHPSSPTIQPLFQPRQSKEVPSYGGVTISGETVHTPGKRRKRTSSMSPEQKAKESARKTAQKKRKLLAAKMNPNSQI